MREEKSDAMRLEWSDIVTEADLERELMMVRSAAAGESAGIFGPNSVSWKLDREAAVFLGAGRALLLQLAHPWVAAAIAEHSRTLNDPIGRFQRTFNITLTMMFGSTAQAIAAARRLHRRHAGIHGTLTERTGPFAAGSCYRANDVAALRWVHATLVETAVIAHDLILPPLSGEERERYWVEARLFAGFFGIPQDALARNWAGFAADNEAILRSPVLTAGAEARAITAAILSGSGTWVPIPSWYRGLTARLLPERLREEFGLAYGAIEQRKTERALAVLRRLYPLLPRRLRHVGPYQEACARLAGQMRPGIVTQLLNRIWMGQKSMTGEGEG